MVLGTIGTILISLVIISYLAEENDIKSYAVVFLGLPLTLAYIDYLEKKDGISRKLTWISNNFNFSFFILYLLLKAIFGNRVR